MYLNVLALPPDIEEPPKDVATVDGLSVTMTCKVFGAPKPVVKWVRDGLELTGGRYQVLDSGNLEIRSASFPHFPVHKVHFLVPKIHLILHNVHKAHFIVH